MHLDLRACTHLRVVGCLKTLPEWASVPHTLRGWMAFSVSPNSALKPATDTIDWHIVSAWQPKPMATVQNATLGLSTHNPVF